MFQLGYLCVIGYYKPVIPSGSDIGEIIGSHYNYLMYYYINTKNK